MIYALLRLKKTRDHKLLPLNGCAKLCSTSALFVCIVVRRKLCLSTDFVATERLGTQDCYKNISLNKASKLCGIIFKKFENGLLYSKKDEVSSINLPQLATRLSTPHPCRTNVKHPLPVSDCDGRRG